MHDMKQAYISIQSDMLQASEGGLEAIEHWKLQPLQHRRSNA